MIQIRQSVSTTDEKNRFSQKTPFFVSPKPASPLDFRLPADCGRYNLLGQIRIEKKRKTMEKQGIPRFMIDTSIMFCSPVTVYTAKRDGTFVARCHSVPGMVKRLMGRWRRRLRRI